LYIAFSKNTSDAEVAKWQAALDAMKADGSYDALIMKYM
jgi:polar amino acid transport system substrate-binding protein